MNSDEIHHIFLKQLNLIDGTHTAPKERNASEFHNPESITS